MAHTENLGLPLIDDTMTADISRDLNALAEAVDTAVTEAVANVEVPLSDVTSGTRSDVAASEKAVGVVMAEAQAAKTTANAANTAAANAGTKADTAIAHLAEKAAVADVGNKANLQTSNKTNLVAAVNEVFTNANNLKSDWAGVVGSPLVSTDTSAQLKSKTQTIKDTMASNLTAKGQASTGTEGLAQLAGKISQIVTGKRYAEGISTVLVNVGLQVTGLGFKPSTVVFSRAEGDGYDHRAQGIIKDYLHVYMGDNPYGYVTLIEAMGSTEQLAVTNKTGNASNQYLFQGGFSTGAFSYMGGKMKWRAYE